MCVIIQISVKIIPSFYGRNCRRKKIMLERRKPRTARIGVFGVGHPVYWGQFPGLYETLLSFHEEFKKILLENDVEVVDYGMVDYSEKAYATLQKMQGDNLDVVMCNMLTYATSSVFAPIIRDLNKPMVLAILNNGMALLNVGSYWQSIVIGLVLLFAGSVDAIKGDSLKRKI